MTTATSPSASALMPIASQPSSPRAFSSSTDADSPGAVFAGSKGGSATIKYSHRVMVAARYE